MATRTLVTKVQRLETLARARRSRDAPILALLRDDPAQMMEAAGMAPDPWQAQVLRCASRRILLLCSRQSGKSTTAAALALRTALLRPHALVLILSRALRQSGEFFRDKLLR